VALFGGIQLNGELSKFRNFQSFGNTLTTLYTISTAEGYADVLTACVQPPLCDEGAGDCGNWVAYVYFPVWVFWSTSFMLNLFITVLLDAFSWKGKMSAMEVDLQCFSEFQVHWLEHDPTASHQLHWKVVENVLSNLPFPMGIRANKLQELREMSIPLSPNGMAWYKDVLKGLIRRYFDIDLNTAEIVTRLLPVAHHHRIPKNLMMLHHAYAVTKIERFRLGFVLRWGDMKAYNRRLQWKGYPE
jgi:hypothetical protein